MSWRDLVNYPDPDQDNSDLVPYHDSNDNDNDNGSDNDSDNNELVLETEQDLGEFLQVLGDTDGSWNDSITFVTRINQGLELPDLVNSTSNAQFLPNEQFLYYLEHVTNDLYFKTGIVYPMHSDTKSFVNVHFETMNIEVSNQLVKVLKEQTERFIVVPVALYFPDITENYTTTSGQESRSGHANVIIIDNENKIIEFFEPHGQQFLGKLGRIIDIQYSLACFLATIDVKYTTFSFKNASSCVLGIQEAQGIHEDVGHCLAWTMLFITLRLLNDDLDTQQILENFTSNFGISQQSIIIKRFISTIEDYYFTNQGDPVSFSKLNVCLSQESQSNMTMRLIDLVAQYKHLLDTNNFKQATFLFNEIVMYTKLPLFHFIMKNLTE